MPTLVSLLGVLVSAGFMVAAGIMNWRYGLRLGRRPDDQVLFAAIAAGVDTMKVLLPFVIWWSLRNRRWVVCLLSSVAIVALMSYSLTGIAGFVDLNRTLTTGEVATKKDELRQLRTSVRRIQAQREAIGVFEIPEAINERLRAMQQDRRWSSSSNCTNATVAESRSFCASFHALNGERARGLEARRLDAELGRLRQSISGFSSVRSVEHGDPRGEVVSRITGWELVNVQTGITILLVGIIEGMSTFGIFLSLNHGQIARGLNEGRRLVRRGATTGSRSGDERGTIMDRRTDEIAKFAATALQPVSDASTCVAGLYARYKDWCNQTRSACLDEASFQADFEAMCRKFGFGIEWVDGRLHCLGLGAADDLPPCS